MSHANLALFAALGLATPFSASAAEKPRVFISESQSLQVSANAALDGAKGELDVHGPSSPQNIEVMKAFAERCPQVVVTSNRDKADYVLRFDHDEINPTTLFVHGNKVAVFDRNDDLVYSDATRLLRNAVKGACTALVRMSANRSAQ